MRWLEIQNETIKLSDIGGKGSSPADVFIDELYSISEENPFNPKKRVIGSTSVEVSKHKTDEIHISDIQSYERGDGSKALQIICDLADKHGVTMSLFASSYGNVPVEKLVEWYTRYGFVVKSNNDKESVKMIRSPK